MFEHIREDLRRFHKLDHTRDGRQDLLYISWDTGKAVIGVFLHSPGFKALGWYRLGTWLRVVSAVPYWWPVMVILTPVYWAMMTYYRVAYDIRLELSAEIGPGLYIGHFGGIHLRNCRIGKNCAIQHEVRICPASTDTDGPTIGNHVWIGAHSRIEGRVSVGDRATIAAGTNVTEDVRDGCLILGNPARVCRSNYDNSAFL